MDRECEVPGDVSWKKSAIKQGYLINIHRGLLKAPKMQYFVLTASGLVCFNGKPDDDTMPLSFLPFEELSSIKLDHVELNSCKLCCMQLTKKTTSNFVLAFSRKEERDEWMMEMMTAFSQALIRTRVFSKSSNRDDSSETKAQDKSDEEAIFGRTTSTSSYGQTLRRKRRKGDRGSIRRSKSYDSLALHDVTNAGLTFPKPSTTNPLRSVDEETAYLVSRKRKSEPDVHVISHFPSAWNTESKDKLFPSSCSFEHRDSLTVQAAAKLKSKTDAKQRTNIISKLRSRLEHPVKHVHVRD